jgi:hypothetical protein
MALGAVLIVGCSRFHTKQLDYSYENGKVTRCIVTKATSTTFFDSQSSLSSFRASQTDKSQSATVGSLNQESSSPTNAMAKLDALILLLGGK